MRIKFEEKRHKYFTEDDKELISVSAFVDQFKHKPDWDKIAAKVAKSQGKTKKEILDLWEMKRVKGTEAGTIIHADKEYKLTNDEFIYEQRLLNKRICEIQDGFKWSFSLKEIENNNVYPELIVYDLENMVCGQSDKVVIKDNTINIFDYKTDKSIEWKSYSSEWQKPTKFKTPISHLDQCNGNEYSLKMSMYMYMLWKQLKGKFKPGKIILEWCPLERDEIGVPILYNGKPKITKEEMIEIPYRKNEVINMLKCRQIF